MADKASNVVLNFKMNGQVQYAQTLKQINMVMTTASKEYTNHVLAMGKDASATEKLLAEKKKLETQLTASAKKVEMLTAEYEAMQNSTTATADDLQKLYNQVLTAENAHTKLENAMKRVEEGLSDEAISAGKAKDELKQLQNEMKVLDSEQKKLISSFELQTAALGENASEVEKETLAQKQYGKQLELTQKVVGTLEKQLSAAKKVYGENSKEVLDLETKLNKAKTEITKFSKALGSIDDSGKKAADGVEDLNKKLGAVTLLEAGEALQGVTDKLLGLGQASMDTALSFGDSQTNLQANLGLTADEAEKLNDVVRDVFKNGVVESIDEASQAVILVKQNFGELNDVDLESLTNKITTLSKRTGTDVQDNVLATSKMMNEFGISGEKALDLIAAGYQNNLNKNGDFLDAIDEFSPHFKNAGYTAEEMLQIIDNGLKNGALNATLAGDAVKEFQIKLGDGSYEEIMKNYSKETQAVFKQWKDGKATTSDVADSISKDLKKMSPNEQQEALSQLASQFEDLGVEGAAALFSVGDAFSDTTGKAEEMSEKSPGEKWTSSLRELSDAFAPVGQQMTDVLIPILDSLTQIGDKFSELPEPVQTFITVFGSLIAIGAILLPLIVGITAAVVALEVSLLPIILIIVGVAAAIAAIIVVIQNWGAITDWIGEKWDQFTKWFSEIASTLKEWVVNKFKELAEGVVKKFIELKEGATLAFNTFKDFVAEKAGEMATKFINKVIDMKDKSIQKFKDLVAEGKKKFDDLKEKIVSPIEKAKDAVKTAIDKIKGFFDGLKLELPDIKTPHFKLKNWSINPKDWLEKMPSIGIEWYAKGGIMTRPTVFGMNGNNMMVGGEADPEGVIPLNKETLGAIGQGIAEASGLNNVNVVVYLDTDELNQKLAPGMSKEINRNNQITARRVGVIL